MVVRNTQASVLYSIYRRGKEKEHSSNILNIQMISTKVAGFIMKREYMSSEESGDDDHILLHQWRSDYVTKKFSKVDAYVGSKKVGLP